MPEVTVQPKIALPELEYTLDDERNSLLNARLQQGATEGLWDTYNRLRLITTVRERHLLSALTQLHELRASSEELRDALRGVSSRHIEGPCFCDIPDTHVFLSHEDWCTKARAALNLSQPSPASAVKGE